MVKEGPLFIVEILESNKWGGILLKMSEDHFFPTKSWKAEACIKKLVYCTIS